MALPEKTLQTLRREIDDIDDQMHDLLMKRVAMMDRVRAAKGPGGPLSRPGREATILRRLVGRHKGSLPPQVVVRLWREIISALTGLQGTFAVAAYAPKGAHYCLDLVRDHFSSLTPIRACASLGQVINALLDSEAQLGVVPLPQDGPDEPWWIGLGAPPARLGGRKTLNILARLPFTQGGAGRPALVIGPQPFDPTGADRGYLVVEADRSISRARFTAILAAVELKPVAFTANTEDEGGRGGRALHLNLIETENWVDPEDPRLGKFLSQFDEGTVRVRSAGGYATPIMLESTARKRK